MVFLVVLNCDDAIRFTAMHAGSENTNVCGRIVCRALWRDDGLVRRLRLSVDGEINGTPLSKEDVVTHLPDIEKAIDHETFAFGSFIGPGRMGYTFAHGTQSPRFIWRDVVVTAVTWLLLPVYLFVALWWLLSFRDAWRKSRQSKAVVEQRCHRCGYDMRYIDRDRCPECGAPLTSD